MAPFNKREIGYIKAIADVGGHTSYRDNTLNPSPTLNKLAAATSHDGKGKYAFVSIGNSPKVWTSGSTDTTHDIKTARPWFYSIPVYDVTVNTDETAVGIGERVTPECYLESVHARMRLIQELDVTDNFQSHQEYRMCVFRHKERQSDDPRFAQNFANPLYDMFVAGNNHKYGPLGYRQKADTNAGSNDYYGATDSNNDIQNMMCMMTNKEDYVFMKDVRFYLGKEYGGKHIYEDVLHWDHADPIATEATDLSHNDSNNKNYTWYIAFFCTTNGFGVADFPYIRFDTTTHVTSG